ncbi:glycoside hydrolase family 25 protein [Spongiactinospora sp. TRM90649]|uniref:glycoside hydrolase family 25 protein n=1 Tax=Spongiactinospora sp. TRM90649 TaxID=3031114 RepID=UPI0023F74206|nr:glycoside hydrolase family 25 protein [Spongiactinospora sp. TRM90649]MDF5752019.1 glycoside hydrolase family 25 protein [Spongiactinospora sp. TRM90649]
MLTGIDVSDRQGAPDWGAHAGTGVAFAFARASEGAAVTDASFGRNWTAMREHGLVRGAYHVARPKSGAEPAAGHFLAVVESAGGLAAGDLLALDLESSGGLPPAEVAAFAVAWCEAVERRTGVRPFVRTYASFALAGNCAGLGGHPLWISSPGRPPGDPEVPAPWRAWRIHQYAHSPLDLNVFPDGLRELTALGLGPR